jgi:hypothetical protein
MKERSRDIILVEGGKPISIDNVGNGREGRRMEFVYGSLSSLILLIGTSSNTTVFLVISQCN